MLIYAKLMTGDLIQLDIPAWSTSSNVADALHRVDPKKYPTEYVRVLKEDTPFTENEIVPVFIDMDPLFKLHTAYIYNDETLETIAHKREFYIEIEFDLKNTIDIISFDDQDPSRDSPHFKKTELADDEWDSYFKRIKKEFHRDDKKVRNGILRIQKNNENYEVTVRPFCFKNFAHSERMRTLKDIHELSTIDLGIFFKYDMVKVLGENDLAYQLLSFRFNELVAEDIISLFEKVKKNVIERPYMYSLEIYARILKENSGIPCVDYSLYKEILHQIDPLTVLDIELDCHEEDYDDEGPRHVEKYWAILIKEIDGTYKIKWHNSFLSRRSYQVDGSEKVLSTHGFDPEIHTTTFLNKEIEKAETPFRTYLLESNDLKLKYACIM